MKTILLFTIFLNLNAYADTIELTSGESIYMNGTRVSCSGQATPDRSIDSMDSVISLSSGNIKCSKAVTIFNQGRSSSNVNLQANCKTLRAYVSQKFTIVAKGLRSGEEIKVKIKDIEVTSASKFLDVINSLSSETLSASANYMNTRSSSPYLKNIIVTITKY